MKFLGHGTADEQEFQIVLEFLLQQGMFAGQEFHTIVESYL